MKPANSTQWRFSGLEFQLLWEAAGRDRLPYPLRFRTEAPTLNDLTAQRKFAAESVQSILDESVIDALRILAEPTVRVEVSGLRRRNMVMIRLHGALSGESAVLVRQLPGIDADTGSDVILSVNYASSLVHTMVTHLPPCPAGKVRGVSVRNAENASAHIQSNGLGESISRRADSPRAAEELGRFFNRPRTSIGEITIASGIAVDSRHNAGDVHFQWNDFADDGRYIVESGDTLRAFAASDLDVETAITRAISTKRAKG